ncbi:class I SAM-dependent methyltransferase [Jannaschia sp. M317]|uniref:class I SAM-dependent methyltransferase n=1 Tax=Jannaschia sp. M317 TaxID=2867011 RepID=UPI0021A6C4D1|nr:methyltransferase domain-containing protein [Jannaschia sp. M317]UWQ16273.1 methyltransferase domain-containing protein [Jannaschia sp. M317]
MTVYDPIPPLPIRIVARRFGGWHVSITRAAPPVQHLKQSYDAVAPRWDRIMRRTDSRAAYRALLAADVGVARLPSDAPVLDCGAGTGALSLALWKIRGGPQGQVACDLSAAMRDAARAAFRAHGARIGVDAGDITALPYADDRFALTMAAHVCEHLPDPVDALAEMARVTRPGGQVLVVMTRDGLAGRLIQARWATHVVTPDMGRAIMRQAGLTRVTSRAAPAIGGLARRSVVLSGYVPDAGARV